MLPLSKEPRDGTEELGDDNIWKPCTMRNSRQATISLEKLLKSPAAQAGNDHCKISNNR
jgi:hypothetical protein